MSKQERINELTELVKRDFLIYKSKLEGVKEQLSDLNNKIERNPDKGFDESYVNGMLNTSYKNYEIILYTLEIYLNNLGVNDKEYSMKGA